MRILFRSAAVALVYGVLSSASFPNYAQSADGKQFGKTGSATGTNITLCYADGKSVYLLLPGAAKGVKIFSEKSIGDVWISPRGDQVAYTRNGDGEDVRRFLCVYNLATSKSRQLKTVPGENNYGPVWSPDGKWIAYRHYQPGGWRVGIVRSDDSENRIVGEKLDPENKNISLEPTWWEPDSKSLWVYDLDFFYHLDLDGRELKRVPFKQMLKDVEQSSGYSFALSSDGKQLLFDALKEVDDVDAEGYSASLVFVRDMQSGDCRRVSPRAYQAHSPKWLNSSEIVYFGAGKSSGVYRMKLDGTTPTAQLLIRGDYRHVSATATPTP